MYNTRDYVNLYNAYRLNGQNVSRAREAFIKRFPDRPRPSRSTIQRLVTRFNTSGNVGRRKKKGRRRTQLTEDNTINIVANVIVEDQLSIRTRALHSGLTKSSLHRILKETNMKAEPLKQPIIKSYILETMKDDWCFVIGSKSNEGMIRIFPRE